MIAFAKRNIRLFFRDKSAVFFSLLAVFIIIGLYALFLGDVWTENFSDIANARQIMDAWIMGGLVAVTSVTATMGAFGVLVDDRTKKIEKDFAASPVKKASLAGGYILSAFTVGVVMSLVALVLAQGYMLLGGGAMLSAAAYLKLLGLIVLTTLANTAMVFFMVSFFRSQNAFSTASTVIGTLIGFVTGIYLPIGTLPAAVQWVVKCFPVSQAVGLFRQVMMADQLAIGFAGAPAQAVTEFRQMLGVDYVFGGHTVTAMEAVLILLATAAVFYGLSVWRMRQKQR